MKLFLATIALLLTSANATSCSCIRERGSLEDQVAAAFASATLEAISQVICYLANGNFDRNTR